MRIMVNKTKRSPAFFITKISAKVMEHLFTRHIKIQIPPCGGIQQVSANLLVYK
jgi:hypothetical protein